MTDQERVLWAIHEAQLILAQYVEPGPRDAIETINELLAILDRSDLVEVSTASKSSSACGFPDTKVRFAHDQDSEVDAGDRQIGHT